MKISTTNRNKTPSKRLDMSNLRAALHDSRQWIAVGTIVDPGRGGDHWEVVTENGARVDLLVEVEIAPGGEYITARLGNAIGSGGVWRVPNVGDEVIVALPSGELDFMPTVVSIMATENVPARVGTDKTILVAMDRIEIDAPKVYLGNNLATIIEATDGLVHGSGIEPFTGATYAALSSCTNKVFAKKA
jgi:hypothetical protein